MLTNYLKFALRNARRNKSFSLLNILGLSVSLTAVILMALFIENELSFDNYHEKGDRIYRVVDSKKTTDVLLNSAATAAPVGPALQHDFPEIEAFARLIQTDALIKNDEYQSKERSGFFADPGVSKIFDISWIDGSAAQALVNPQSIVLTKTMATRYFGSTAAVGKALIVDRINMLVTGVIDDLPQNTHLRFDFLISMSTAQQKGSGYDWLFTNWYSNNGYTYILLPKDYDPSNLVKKLTEFDRSHDEAGDNTTHYYSLEKLRDIYLHSTRADQIGATGNLRNLYIFSAVAVFILLLACINFINLSTASAANRAREVGVKKVVGATRNQLVNQFLIESFLTVTFSMLLAVIFSILILPAFNNFAEKSLKLEVFSSQHLIAMIMIVTGIGLLSGSYPAFILSGFKPSSALKGRIFSSVWNLNLRRTLVVFQFTVSILLIICTLVVYMQMNFLQNQDLGFKTSQTLVINFEGDKNVRNKLEYIKSALLQIQGVKNIAASSSVPGDGTAGTWSMDFALHSSDTVHTELPVYLVDYHFLKQYNIPITAGRGFDLKYAADSTESILINETALRRLGIKNAEDVIGKNVGMYPTDGKIVGIVKDFHFESLQKPVEPLLLRILPLQLRLLSLELQGNNIKQTIASIEKSWKQLVPERPLEYKFLDETFNRQYDGEVKFGRVFGIFSFLAVFIACLGLSGLAAISTIQRTKEIGIRKILGASVISLTRLLGGNYLLLICISIMIASPIGWFAMKTWLNNFAYRGQISIWIFLTAGLGAAFMALVTVSFHSIRVATSNPINSLKNE